jgi:hypothetical protein
MEIKVLSLTKHAIDIAPLRNETLNSFLSRYHLLSCNALPRTTLCYLLGYIPTSNNWSSFMLQRLAKNIGEGFQTFERLIRNNTLHHQSFLHSSTSNTVIDKLYRTTGTNRVLLERKAKHFRICTTCWHSDINTLGYSFVKIQHQTPEIKVCADHGVVLIDKCQGCKKHFSESNFISELPWNGCCCGWTIKDSSPTKSPEHNELDLDLSRLAAHQLNIRFHLGAMSLADAYQFRIEKLVAGRGEIDIIKFIFFSAETKYGIEALQHSIPDYLKLKYLTTQGLPPQFILSPNNSWLFHILVILSLFETLEAAILFMDKLNSRQPLHQQQQTS